MADGDPWTDFDSTPYRLQDMVYAEMEKVLSGFAKGKVGWVVWPERTFSHRSGIALIGPDGGHRRLRVFSRRAGEVLPGRADEWHMYVAADLGRPGEEDEKGPDASRAAPVVYGECETLGEVRRGDDFAGAVVAMLPPYLARHGDKRVYGDSKLGPQGPVAADAK